MSSGREKQHINWRDTLLNWAGVVGLAVGLVTVSPLAIVWFWGISNGIWLALVIASSHVFYLMGAGKLVYREDAAD